MPADILINSFVGIAAALIGAGVIVVGWKVAHRQELERDIVAKRRELRIQYLIEAYRRLEYVSNRPLTPETAPDFERAIADIQLFGSPDQVVLAQEFAREFAKTGSAPLDPLLSQLRQSLRDEIDLGKVPPQLVYVRMSFDAAGKVRPRDVH